MTAGDWKALAITMVVALLFAAVCWLFTEAVGALREDIRERTLDEREARADDGTATSRSLSAPFNWADEDWDWEESA